MSTLRPRPEPGSAGQPEPAVQPGQPVPPVQLAGASPELQAAVEAVLGAGVATLTLEDALAQLAKGPPPGCLLVALADGEGPGPWRALLERAAAPVPLVGLAGPGQEALAARWLDEGGDEVVPPGALALLPALLRRLERRRHAAREEADGHLRQARSALEASERRFRDLFQYTSDATVLYKVDADGTVSCEDFNPAAEAASGFKREELVGRQVHEVVEPRSAAKLAERYAQAVRTRAPIVYEHDLQLPAGTRWFNTAIVPFLDEAGRVYRLASIARDVTLSREADALQRRLEAQLAESQKTDALARLASHIARDVNHLLTDIVVHARALAGQAPEGAGAILEATARGRELTQQVLTLGRSRPPDRRPLELLAQVKGTLPLLAPFRGGVELAVREPPGPVRVRGDERQLDQVLTTLCLHALQQLEGRGTLTVGVSLVELDYAFAAAHPPLQAGRWACLEVADTGAGLGEDARRRIFEPFFGGGPGGRGTGLELAVAQAIVRAHGGDIVVEASPGLGSSFRVYLPALEEDEARQRPGQGQHLMLVDDHPGMARVSGRLLETLGYRASVYDDPREALAAFQARPEAFDAVLTDLCMPQMSGEDFTRSLHALRPPLPVIVTSGLAEELEGERLKSLGVSAVLMKPWRLEEVVATLEQVLGARGPG